MEGRSRSLKKLAALLKASRKGGIIFCVYDTPVSRRVMVARLKRMLTGVGWHEVELTPRMSNVWAVLESLGGTEEAGVVMVYGLDDLPDEIRLREVRGLNQGRESLAHLAFPIVFWVYPEVAQEVARYAPDLWHWRSGVFEFFSVVKTDEDGLRVHELRRLPVGSLS